MTPPRRSALALGVCPLAALGGTGVLGLPGCADDGVRPVAPDTTPPTIQVVSPVDTAYDLDGDKLLDLQLAWADSGSPVDPASVRVGSLRGVNGTADATTDSLSVWRVVRRDRTGLLARETLDELLHGGANQLEVVAADSAGNVAVDTTTFTLPHGALFATIVTGLSGFFAQSRSDPDRLYVGETTSGTVGIVIRSQGARRGTRERESLERTGGPGTSSFTPQGS
jgi:hypothetical protein